MQRIVRITFGLFAAMLLAGCLPAAGGRSVPPPVVYSPPQVSPGFVQRPPAAVANPWKPDGPPREWRHIVIHHTASSNGSVESIHETHLARGWQGIGYHFVIGNGSGMSDGVIEPTFRWREQLHGAHAGKDEYNQHGIGICLVGNFETAAPSSAQLASIRRLVAVLKSEYQIPASAVIGHSDVKATACPGKHFPMTEVASTSLVPVLVEWPGMSPPDRVAVAGLPVGVAGLQVGVPGPQVIVAGAKSVPVNRSHVR